MTKMKRISRACRRCRQRKAKCDLGSSGTPGAPPCEACIRDQVECILADSNRGGRRVRKSAVPPAFNHGRQNLSMSSHENRPHAGLSHEFPQQPINGPGTPLTQEAITSNNIEETFASTDLHSTSDALNLLSQAAELGTYATPGQRSHGTVQDVATVSPENQMTMDSRHIGGPDQFVRDGPLRYPLVSKGLLTTAEVEMLVARFKENYHHYLPIVPRRSFDAASLQFMASQEPNLLTAIITVAARDLPQGERILKVCSSYMHQLVSEISAGKKCDVEAVEALLLLAEWEPQEPISESRTVGCGEEDRAAWMHVGLALRVGYFLGLDRTAIKYDDEEKANNFNRRRVTWAVCYISDRQLSARMGRAFWSRGPGPIVGLGRHGRQTFDDFPSLQPQGPGDDDHASIIQASLDLTQLFSNVHDILYAGMGISMKSMLAGNYVKYVDDFRTAIVGWKSVWGTLTCSPNLKSTLQMSYEYLRLYTNAYAFQATTQRSVAAKAPNAAGIIEIPLNGIASMPDARFIYESVDAAKSLLSIVNSYIDAETCLRFLPLRFALYCVNSAVFLYKAWSFGVLSAQEKLGIRHLISDAIAHLQKASVRPNDFTSRYSQLLSLLWQRKDADRLNANPDSGSAPIQLPFVTTPSSSAPYIQQDDFSWLDLQAVGELVLGDLDGTAVGQADLGNAGYAVDSQFVNMLGDWNDVGWMQGEDYTRLF